jgi:L-asparaginase
MIDKKNKSINLCKLNELDAKIEYMHVVIISTGGTIDKIYDEKKGVMKNQGPMIVKNIGKFLRLPYCTLEFINLMSKDSLHMDINDRLEIAACIKKVEKTGKSIVVLHGTDTMDQSAQICLNQIPKPSVPVIFTGAMKPYGLEGSDAEQNLTEALICAKYLQNGIYIVFHNHIFNAETVRKNHKKLTFENHQQ